MSGTEETIGAGEGGAPRPKGWGTGGQPLSRGELVGRYVVLSELGAGGMGVVYAAYDPELDRKVALKLLRPGVGGGGSDGETRLLREAQALARLSHPNVVTVHDVGTRSDDVWLAMEFVPGQTLAQWLEHGDRHWREVLSIMRAVAAGLVAAHDAGLVHRDVKPDNIMIGEDGRTRVMDFGLARGTDRTSLVDDRSTEVPELADGARSNPRLEVVVTRAGSTLGTPAYMAPEQVLGEPTDARTDQFSFCVTLWEALYGERPFDGATLLELAANIAEGNRRPAPRRASVPEWLARVLRRGLAVEPGDRWPSLAALLEGLDRGRSRARLTRVGAAAGAVAMAAAGVIALQELDHRRVQTGCERTGAEVEAVWNDEATEAVRAGLMANGLAYAGATAERVIPLLTARAEAWRTARTETCLDAELGRWSADLVERSRWCLDQRSMELGAMVQALGRADPTMVSKAVMAISVLERIEACRDEELLRRSPSPPTDSFEDARAVQQVLSTASALDTTGAYAEGLEVARDGLERAKALGWPVLIASGHYHLGLLLDRSGEYDDAEATLEDAYFEAAAAGVASTAQDAAHELARILAQQLNRPGDAERWWRHGEVLRQELGDPWRLREARSLERLAVIRQTQGEYASAATASAESLAILEDTFGADHPAVGAALTVSAGLSWANGDLDEAARMSIRAAAIMEKALGPQHPGVGQALNNVATQTFQAGNVAEAVSVYLRALGILEAALGPDHVIVSATLNNLGICHRALGQTEASIELHRRALEIRTNKLGPEHPLVAESQSNLALSLEAIGSVEEAAELHARVLIVRERALGPDHPTVAKTLSNLGAIEMKRGAVERAIEQFERALAIRETALGPDHVLVGQALVNLAAAHRASGSHEESAASDERALKILEKGLGPDDPMVAYPLTGLARDALARHRPADAVVWAERALAVREGSDEEPTQVAASRFLLAEALDAAEGGPRVVVLAKQARDAYLEDGEESAEALAEVEAFLARHGEAR